MDFKLIKFIFILSIIIILYNNIYYKKEFILPNIIGGIGNQMFIIASAYSYGKRNNKVLVLDGRTNIHSYGGYRNHNNDTIFYNIKKNNYLTDLKHIKEDDYYKIIEGNIYLTGGYYQDYNYFDEYKYDIINLFKPNYKIKYELEKLKIKYKMNNTNNICVHIRLVDKWTPYDHEGLYTKEEINKIKNKLNELKGNKLIFSNDIDKCKNIFNQDDFVFINEKDYLELYLMSYCDYYIASPSTFNWWGIYLNKSNYDIYIPWNKDSEYRKDFFNKFNVFKKY